MRTLNDELESIVIGEPVHFGNLTVFPLLRSGSNGKEPDYLLLDEAVARGSARVTELGEGGSVPELLFQNLGDKPVLLFDGEELIGAKQNRTVNLTILAPARQSIVIPVSCVEAGRWHNKSPDFRPAAHVMYSRGRAARAAQVTCSMESTGSRRSDQSAVWEDIASKSERMGSVSPTQAMAAIYDSHAVLLDGYSRAFQWSEGQSGALFAIANTFGLDLLDCSEAMRRLFSRLLRSYALDAAEAPHSALAKIADAAGFLSCVGKSTLIAHQAVGLGKDVRLSANGISGAALWAEERYVHICAFAMNGAGPRVANWISRPARRRVR